MAKPIPIESVEHAKIFLLIHKGIQTPNKIKKELNNSATKPISLSGLSQKLRHLRDLKFIESKRLRSIGKSSTAKYYINFEGIIKERIYQDLFNKKTNSEDIELLTTHFNKYLHISQTYLSHKNFINLNDLVKGFVNGSFRKYVNMLEENDISNISEVFVKYLILARKYVMSQIQTDLSLAAETSLN